MADSDDADRKQRQIDGLKRAVAYFSSSNKPARERWVVTKFLRNLGFEDAESEVKSPTQDPPDVEAYGCRFEVKEILDIERRRHGEFKSELARAEQSEHVVNLTKQVTPIDLTVLKIHDLCLAQVENYENHYPVALRRTLDLLFYVNLEGVFSLRRGRYPSQVRFQAKEWRSISFVVDKASSCIVASSDAPPFLQQVAGRFVRHVR